MLIINLIIIDLQSFQYTIFLFIWTITQLLYQPVHTLYTYVDTSPKQQQNSRLWCNHRVDMMGSFPNLNNVVLISANRWQYKGGTTAERIPAGSYVWEEYARCKILHTLFLQQSLYLPSEQLHVLNNEPVFSWAVICRFSLPLVFSFCKENSPLHCYML